MSALRWMDSFSISSGTICETAQCTASKLALWAVQVSGVGLGSRISISSWPVIAAGAAQLSSAQHPAEVWQHTDDGGCCYPASRMAD